MNGAQVFPSSNAGHLNDGVKILESFCQVFMLGVGEGYVGLLPNLTPSFKLAHDIPSDDLADLFMIAFATEL